MRNFFNTKINFKEKLLLFLKFLRSGKFLISLFLLTGIFFIFTLAINISIINSTKSYIYKNTNTAPSKQVALLLGSLVYPDGRLSDVMEDRVLTAAELYKNQKVKKILVSGDHGRKNYDETNTIKIHLLRLGIPPADIFLDHAGFDTYDSLYRASAVFHVDSAIIVTQAFHLPRAVYIGKSLKIDVVGVIADRRKYRSVYLNEGREIIARIKAFFDVTLSAKPKFLGDVIPINGDGKKSWDKL